MRNGIPLNDRDRAPWLAAMRKAIEQWNSEHQNVVLACSALKRKYRHKLRTGPVQFVFLKGRYELILSRLRSRTGHFASESILAGKCAALAEPEDAIIVTVDKSPDAIVLKIIAQLKLPQSRILFRQKI